MFGSFTQLIDNILGRPPKANANDPYRRDYQARQQQKRRRLTPAEESAEATKQLERLVGPVSEQPLMPVQRSSSPSFSFASSSNVRLAEHATETSTASHASSIHHPSGSTATLTPNPPQQNLAPGMVPVPSVASTQSTLNYFSQLMDRSGSLKHSATELLARCETLARIINEMPLELSKTPTFISRISEIDNNVKETTRYLEEWNKKNKYKQAVGKKDMYMRIAKLDRAIHGHYVQIMAIQGGYTSKQVTKIVEGVEPEENQVKESEFVQHVKEVTGQDAPTTHILNKKIHHRENTSFATSNNFDIYKGELVEGREPIAIKIYREKIKLDQNCVKFVERMMRQVTLWTSFQDPSVLECYGIGMQVTKSSEQSFDRLQFYLVSPLLRNGNAVSFIARRRQAGLYVNILEIIRDAAVGIQFLHSQEKPCVHASMRGENVLIRDNGRACINGFGLTKALSEKKPIELTGKNFQVRWMAPELLEQDRPRLLPSCDIWSWAMTALELIAGVPPYHNVESDYGVRDQIVQGSMPEEADYPDFNTYSPQPEMMWALLRKCWAKKPEERPTMDQVIHELDSIHDAQVEKQRAEGSHQWA